MFVIDNNGNIAITRGDNAEIQLTVVRADWTTRDFKKGDVITMTVKKRVRDEESVMLLHGNKTGLIKIKPSDYILDEEEGTLIPCGNYVFDVQLTTAKGEIYTVVPTRTMSIVEDVTRE